MRIKIQADVGDGLTIPINYNHLLTGVIYRFLAESNPEYATFLHNEGYGDEPRRFKLFTFSQLMAERRRITRTQIHFASTITWSVSSPVEDFLSHFANTLLTEGRLTIGGHRLQVQDVTVPRTPRFQSEMRFRCLSPIVMTTVRERDGNSGMHYCLPDDPAFSELVRRNLIRKHEVIHGHPPHNDTLTLQFDQNYITRKQGRVTRLIGLQGHQDKGNNVSIECLWKQRVNPDRLRMRFRRQKQRRFRYGRYLNKYKLDLN